MTRERVGTLGVREKDLLRRTQEPCAIGINLDTEQQILEKIKGNLLRVSYLLYHEGDYTGAILEMISENGTYTRGTEIAVPTIYLNSFLFSKLPKGQLGRRYRKN